MYRERPRTNTSHPTSLWVVGLGSQYPDHLLEPESLETFAARFYTVDNPGIQRLLEINRKTGIETRSSIHTYETGYANDATPPSIADMDALFRSVGVDMAVQACRKAMEDWGGTTNDITHTVAVTCTNQGNPGYDFLVNEKLELSSSVDRTLLHGVGCAGGLAIMRSAAQLAHGATMRGRPARILCFACELSTPNVRYELEAAAKCVVLSRLSIAGVLFSDAAAAFVLCNDMGMQKGVEPVFELMDWDTRLIADTVDDLSFRAESTGYRMTLARDVPKHTVAAVRPMFDTLLGSMNAQRPDQKLSGADFDWALHPGGQRIIDGVRQSMSLTESQLGATCETYKTRGNSSSPTVLNILDRLRLARFGKNFVVATAFGPGLVIEMSMLRRCHAGEESAMAEVTGG